MTMARFPRGQYATGGGVPEWITFIREVNGVRPGAFGAPELQNDTPRVGFDTEKYPEARVIHGRSPDEGVRIVADTDDMRAAFREVAERLSIHLADHPTAGTTNCLYLNTNWEPKS